MRWRVREIQLAVDCGRSREPAERIPDVARASRPDNIPGDALSQNFAAVQDDNCVGLRHLVDQMRGPERAEPLRRDKTADVPQNIGPSLDIEADRRFIEQKKPGPMQQGPDDFHTPHLAARKIARLVASTRHKPNVLQKPLAEKPGLTAANSMQSGVIAKVLRQRKIEVEGPRLKDDAKQAQRSARFALKIVTKDADLA